MPDKPIEAALRLLRQAAPVGVSFMPHDDWCGIYGDSWGGDVLSLDDGDAAGLFLLWLDDARKKAELEKAVRQRALAAIERRKALRAVKPEWVKPAFIIRPRPKRCGGCAGFRVNPGRIHKGHCTITNHSTWRGTLACWCGVAADPAALPSR